MAPPSLTIQTLPFYFRGECYQPSNMRGSSTLALTRAHNRRSGEVSELQRRFEDIVKRVVGEDDVASLPHRSPTDDKNPAVNIDGDDDDDVISNYGDVENGGMGREEPRITISRVPATATDPSRGPPTELSISSPSSYTGLAALNPYAFDSEDLVRRMGDELDDDGEHERGGKRKKETMRYEEEIKRDDDYGNLGEQQRRRDAELDRACAAVLAEEYAAKRVLEGLLRWE